MIQIYDIGNENYDRNGNAVLTPTAGRVTMQAGGACDISLTLPMDPDGKWRHVVPGAVVKAPVPREVIENSFSGYAADIYKTVGAADLREDKVAPTQIIYPQWNAMDMTYHVGSRVSCYGWPHQNYECTYFDNSSPITQVPPYNSAWWKPIADYTPGAAVVVSLPAGSELYWIENAGSGWYKMSTYYGLEGYIQTSAVVFDRHVSETENQPRIITEQLFRLREPSINNETRTVTVTGQHVSYDLAGILCKNITITQASPAMAMGRVVENMMMDYRGTIATNLTSEENGTYTGKTNGKNGMFMLLDPDAGIVHAFNAKFTRDNWDVFVMKKTSALSGFRISYAKNMRGVTWKKSSAGLVTRVVPVAKNTDGEDLYLPEKWVDSAHIADYPVILMELLRISAQVGRDDGTGTDTVWTESALFDYMREKAGERFSVDHVDEVVDDLTVQFEQLGDTAEYEWIRPLESVLLYDNIVCQDRDIGLEKVLTVTELEWDPIRRKVTGIRLSNITGAAGRTVTGFNVQNNSITPAKLTEEVTQEIVGQVQALIPDYTDPEAGKYTLPPASSTALGGIKTGFTASGKNYPVALDANNKAYVYVPWDPGSYTLPLAQDGVRGGIQIGFTAYGKNYPVALDGEKAYVYVPWEDHHDWDDITNKPATATRWPSWAEVTDKPNRAGSASDGGPATSALSLRDSRTNGLVINIGDISYNDAGAETYGDNEANRKKFMAFICNNYSNANLHVGTWRPDSRGPIIGNIYDVTAKNSEGIPRYSTFFYNNLGNATPYVFGTNDFNYYSYALLSSNNYTNYTVTKTGSGASGTWGISVTGSAGSVPWTGVGNPPATATRWPTWAEVTEKPTVFYTLPLAASGTRGGVQIGYTQSGKNYPVQLSNEKMYVNVPWTPDGGDADMVDGYHASSLWRSDGGTWNPGADISLGATANNQEWSFDIRRNGKTGCYWHVWDSALGSLLKVNADDGIVSAPHGFSGNITGNVTGNCSGSAGTAGYLTGENPQIAASVENNEIKIVDKRNQINDLYYQMRHAIDFRWYDEHWTIGQYRGGGTNCPNFGIAKNNSTMAYVNEDGSVYARGSFVVNAFGNTPKNLADCIYDISRSGNTFTATRVNGDTFTFTQNANADTVDNYHGEDLLTEVDSFKRRLQIRTGSGSLNNNTDTYIPFSSPFSTLCAAVLPVSTSGFNAPNALSIVSNNKNGVTLKQNNASGVAMNVIVVAFGY